MSIEQDVRATAERAREASHGLALATRAEKDAALLAMADALVAASATRCWPPTPRTCGARRPRGIPANIVDRLRLDEDRVAGMAQGLRDVAGLPDPVGEVVRGGTLANGLELRQVRVPFGVVGMIYEARPNVTADAAGICLKSGNAVLLRGSAERALQQRRHRRRAARRDRGGRARAPTSSSWCRATRTRASRC